MRDSLIRVLSLLDALRQGLFARRAPEDKALGARGEDLAHRFLQKRGYTIVARNYRPPNGHREVDLIARHGRTLVIVEVKTRRREEFLPAERAVDPAKRHNLTRAAMSYARRAHIPWEFVRFDIVTVVLEPQPRLRHTPDAFHPDRRERARPLYAVEVED
ncbi:MAG: YraN family protein [Bryobacterales bacterium]|nr:YraN family protein [Bryobacterales bacterium]